MTTLVAPRPLESAAMRLDPESRRWLERLDADSGERAAAIDELHALLLRAARPEGWDVMPGTAAPEHDAEQRELLDAVREAIATDLTAHQRDVLLAVTVHDVPIDVLAERLDTTRGALYKTIHDARRKLRAALAA